MFVPKKPAKNSGSIKEGHRKLNATAEEQLRKLVGTAPMGKAIRKARGRV